MSESAVNEDLTEASPGSQPQTLTERIRARPLLSLGLAGLAGFVAGGGAFSRTGLAMLMLCGRVWLRRTAVDAIANAMAGHGAAG